MTLSVIAARCQLPRRGSPWQAGQTLLFAWAQFGARQRALSEWAAAAGQCLNKELLSNCRESRQQNPAVLKIKKPCSSSAATTEDVRERIIAMTPLGRLARPDDIAGGVALLASDMAGFITGQCLHVDGGLTMR